MQEQPEQTAPPLDQPYQDPFIVDFVSLRATWQEAARIYWERCKQAEVKLKVYADSSVARERHVLELEEQVRHLTAIKTPTQIEQDMTIEIEKLRERVARLTADLEALRQVAS